MIEEECTGNGAAACRARGPKTDAALKALPVVEAIRALETEVNADSALRLNYNVGVVRAGDWPSSVPEECVLDVRLAAQPGEDLDAVKAGFESTVDAHVEWRGFHAQGFALDRDEPIFEVLGKAHAAVHDRPLEFLAFTGTTDARAFVVHDATPATCYGPIGGNLHAPDEWVDFESVRATALVLALAAAEWCG